MRFVVLYIWLFGFQTLTMAQGIVLKSFVKNDTVQLRWAPQNADGLILGLKNGYSVVRTISNQSVQFNIAPFVERKSEFSNLSTTATDLIPVVESLISGSVPDSDEKRMIYALLLLSAGPDKDISKLLGLYIEDVPGVSAEYRVEIPSSELRSKKTSVDWNRKDRNLPMTKLEGVSRNKAFEAYLRWSADELTSGYSGYWVEKSADSMNFEKLNPVPLIFFKSQDEDDKQFMDFLDTLVEEGQTYFYRVRGINHFGDMGEVTNVVRVYIPRSLSGECRIDSVFADGFQRHIKGRFLFHTNSDVGNLKEFALYRSDSLTFGYQKVQVVAPVRNAFAFNVSSELLNGDRQYYMVAAVSQDSDTTWSYPWYFFTLDQKPPERPIGLVGEIGDSGVVFLRWKPNSERDIRGYRVFMANDLKEEFVEVTAEFVDDTTFYDTLSLRNLSSEVYYKIAAVDRNYNNSDYSDWILLLKPDTIPPVPAVFKSYVVSDTGIVLTWVNSTSDDLQFNKLVRFSWDGGVDTLLRWEHDSCIRFVDSIGLVPGQMRYAILTCDEVPNIRQSHELYVQYELGYRKIQAIINAEVDREKKLILLTWQNEKDDIYSIDVYRSINTGPFKQIGSIFEKFEFGFEDIDLRINNSYTYKIRVTYQSGISSKMSSPLTVIY